MNALDRAEALAWSRVPELMDRWVEKTAAPAWDLKRAVAGVYTGSDVGIYWNPERELAGGFIRFQRPLPQTRQDAAFMKAAMIRAVGRDHLYKFGLDFDDLSSGKWIKVAYSPTLRRTGELLNFFPGLYPGGLPNAPSPLASTLTSGLVGAGLGYGVGWLGEKLLPRKWERGKLRKTLATIGGLGGALPGALWTYSAARRGLSPLDGSDLAGKPTDVPQSVDPRDIPFQTIKKAFDAALEKLPLGKRYVQATEHFVKLAFGDDEDMTTFGNSPLDVNINRMGHVLWETGASPQTAATTMGALYAAQQMPDPRARPGFVTPNQTGLLGTMMAAAGGGAKGYAAGFLAGKALGLLTGMPASTQNTLMNTGAALGVIDAVVPRFFQ